jgi:steroid delta-isomerase-like uncharacterized protein
MANETAVSVATDALEAFNSADWSRFEQRIAPDVVYEETGTGRRVAGRDAYVDLCKGWKQAFPDVSGTIHRSVESGTTAVQEITWVGTHDGVLETAAGAVPATGRKVEVQATWWLTIEGGQAKEVHHHLDVLSLLQQVGAMG